jgi:hypothetical protein
MTLLCCTLNRCCAVLAVRRTVAVAKRKTMLIELSQFDFLWCHEHNLMISELAHTAS